MNRRDLFELGRLCLRAVLYASIAAVTIFALILAIGYFLERTP